MPDFNQFYLCGGTALALQLGHRISVDADFVSENNFDKDNLIKVLIERFSDVTDIHQNQYGVFLRVSGLKLDFLSWNLPFIAEPIEENNIRMIYKKDIIAMKLFAILQRGEKKDYMDIATLLDEYSLKEMLNFYQERHKNSDISLVLRYLSSFSDIDFQPEPNMLNNLTWAVAKQRLQEAIKQYTFNN
ncbi:nucleotidyl transferase AbiEii/AbiGii toxin family protein [Pedobacter sp. BS3]|uniref:nucleotidyl transferase AbiEii/AbiGii toxin family protein n=1 Tax=Pedobacter sp. BS3 TaxID=2567937 RepID=UPI0016597480|nr:nucleotidyl transferase AbiEii/AbiGii toxin family protein [Pedobacter sp. BS3]